MIRFLLVLTLAVVLFAACPPHFPAGNTDDDGAAQAATTFRSEMGRLTQATAAMRQAAAQADMDFPEPRPEVLFPVQR